MGIRESLLNTITSVADSDFVRIVTSAGASSKATVRNLFKGFESNLGAKSSLTTSDYIRVVGSDNEAYKQSVSAVKTAMGIDALDKKIYHNRVSTTSYAVPVDGWVSGNYHTFVMYGGTSSTNTFMYLGWIDNTGSTVVLTPVKADNGRTYTATFNTSTKILTITPSSTLWGGLTVITG